VRERVVISSPRCNCDAGYYNEARILDPKTFQTVTTLPNIPGSVNNFDGGRTYPLEGAAMLLPQHAPYTDLLQILICGGSVSFNIIDIGVESLFTVSSRRHFLVW
jgi:hypothetical protein